MIDVTFHDGNGTTIRIQTDTIEDAVHAVHTAPLAVAEFIQKEIDARPTIRKRNNAR